MVLGDLFDFLFGSSKANRQFENNIGVQKELYGRYNKFMDSPGGLGKDGPGGFINQIASQYQGNPYQQFISNQMIGNQLRASRLDQSSYGLSKVASLNSELASRGLNDFIGSSLGGLQSLIGAHGLGAQIGQNLGGGYTSYGKSLNDRWIAMNQMLDNFGQVAGKAAI
ncbi:hypothetical protein NMD99_04840 [Wolbachia endosymbiont of Listronotus oregonensis]|uniref:hypothetical protein n=1 Tax=Wolbachia endosymbiont of Listronotus oregonensis TaxID=2969106 RepID=UPI00281675FF|nr:hypothetical protein [Wolbachia endosymbiont of Listronotus oregonensis]WMT83991.1 hypothetical protein NMD99_04840 [Wolbachia endosymbiont of Listronotus oregonensis]